MIYRILISHLEPDITDVLTSMNNVIYDFGELLDIVLSYFPTAPVLTLPDYVGVESDREMLTSCVNTVVAHVYPMLFKLNIESVVNVTVDGRYMYVVATPKQIQ